MPEGLVLVTRPGCPLCDRARAVVEKVGQSLGMAVTEVLAAPGSPWEVWSGRVPVVLAGDRVVAEGVVGELALRRALARGPSL